MKTQGFSQQTQCGPISYLFNVQGALTRYGFPVTLMDVVANHSRNNAITINHSYIRAIREVQDIVC